jgi:integrase
MTKPFFQPNSIRLRDGEVVVYRRTRSLIYQCRYKLADGTWHRRSTGKAALEHAIASACDMYDESRYRQKLGLAHRAHSFSHIAGVCLEDLRHQIDLKKTKSSLNDYASIIERYFLPYFGERMIEQLTYNDIREFEMWRDRRLARIPKTSTLNNFSSAWNRVIHTAISHGFISEHVPVPRLTSKGEKGKTRPAFTEQEIEQLLAFMGPWSQSGRLAVEREIRPLTRDYVEFLLLTGIRHGTEAMNVLWKDIECHTHNGVRYLRIWVSGKTGGRFLIAKHRAVDVLKRLHARQKDIAMMAFEVAPSPVQVQRWASATQPRRHIQALDAGFGSIEGLRGTKQDAVLAQAHLRHTRNASWRGGHTHLVKANGQLRGNDRASLLEVDSDYGGGAVGLRLSFERTNHSKSCRGDVLASPVKVNYILDNQTDSVMNCKIFSSFAVAIFLSACGGGGGGNSVQDGPPTQSVTSKSTSGSIASIFVLSN